MTSDIANTFIRSLFVKFKIAENPSLQYQFHWSITVSFEFQFGIKGAISFAKYIRSCQQSVLLQKINSEESNIIFIIQI